LVTQLSLKLKAKPSGNFFRLFNSIALKKLDYQSKTDG